MGINFENDIKDMAKFCNETFMVYLYKKKILKRDEMKLKYEVNNYLLSPIFSLIVSVIFIVCLIIFKLHYGIDSVKGFYIACWIFSFLAIFLNLFLMYIYWKYCRNFKKEMNKEINLEIKKEGLEFSISKNNYLIKWDLIDFIVIGNYSISVLIKNNRLFYRLPLKQEIIDKIKKFNNKIKIIDLR